MVVWTEQTGEAGVSAEVLWFSNDLPAPPPLPARRMAWPPTRALPEVEGGVGGVPLIVEGLLALHSCSRTWESWRS